MTKRWIMDSRARASKKYRELHEQLCRGVYGPKRIVEKPERHRAKAEEFRRLGN